MSLDKFIHLTDGLVQFERLLLQKKVPLASVHSLLIHQEELKSTWDKTKAAYEAFMEERAAHSGAFGRKAWQK